MRYQREIAAQIDMVNFCRPSEVMNQIGSSVDAKLGMELAFHECSAIPCQRLRLRFLSLAAEDFIVARNGFKSEKKRSRYCVREGLYPR